MSEDLVQTSARVQDRRSNNGKALNEVERGDSGWPQNRTCKKQKIARQPQGGTRDGGWDSEETNRGGVWLRKGGKDTGKGPTGSKTLLSPCLRGSLYPNRFNGYVHTLQVYGGTKKGFGEEVKYPLQNKQT